MKFIGRKPRLTADQYARVRQVAELRRSIPSDKELARELGASERAVQRALYGVIKRHAHRLAKEGGQ